MIISVFDRVEILWEKKKMLFVSIFSFSLNVFKIFFFVVVEKSGLWGKKVISNLICRVFMLSISMS